MTSKQVNSIEEAKLNYLCIYNNELDLKEDETNKDLILYYGIEQDIRQDLTKSEEKEEGEVTVTEEELITEELNSDSEEEKEEDAIVRGYSKDYDTILRHIGLAQAMLNFSNNFSTEEKVHTVHSKKSRLIILNPEGDIYFLLSINLGIRIRKSETNSSLTVVDYMDKELNDLSLKTMLNKAYLGFKLGHGSITNLLDKKGVKKTQYYLTEYFDHYLSRGFSLNSLTIENNLNGIQLFSTSKSTFLYLQNQLKNIQLENNSIFHLSFFYNQKLIWSGAHMPIDISNLMLNVIKQLDNKINQVKDDDKKNRNSFFSLITPYLFNNTSTNTETEDIDITFQPKFIKEWDPKSAINGKLRTQQKQTIIKTIYINQQKLYSIIYQIYPKGYLILYFKNRQDININRLNQSISTHLNEQLFNFIKKDSQHQLQLKKNIKSNPFNYCYFNGLNLAIESNLIDLPVQVHCLLLELQNDLLLLNNNNNNDSNNNNKEILLRTISTNHFPPLWIGVKYNLDFQLFFIINKDNNNLMEVEEHIQTISNFHFTNLFLND
ncbi:hypothetical protein K502DRAFT_361953 [Neoconidiobolus thromboides FSU 785]|nr:hypothetical protein K502DRAFT_361953 [Neoconidiobolus thromboides FSU 785]